MMNQQVSPSGPIQLENKNKKGGLGFQFTNKSPRIIPAGALKDIAYSNNLEIGLSNSPEKSRNFME